jgi:hypothetical protein
MTGAALFVLLVILAIGALAYAAARKSQTRRTEIPGEELDPEGRTLLRPVRKLEAEIAELVAHNKGMATVSVLGTEASHEAKRIVEQASNSLRIRADLKRSLRGEFDAQKQIDSMTEKAASAATDQERESLQAAIEARKLELGHYDTIRQTIGQIDGGLRQAEAALAEMKARLAVSVSGEKVELASEGDLRETISRMKALSLSYDEADELLRGSSGT